jgi:hypothetical protein
MAYDFRTLNYLGSKLRLLDFIEENVRKVTPDDAGVCDLFAGSGCVSYKLSRLFPVVACDIQHYSKVICDALLQPGTLTKETVKTFISAHEMHGCSVRGLGFHTPKHPGSSSIVPAKAGRKTFGHQGFTGTVVWCDPDNRLIYVFLSNRVYPNCYPNKLSQSGIRLKAHEMIYQGMKE